MWLHLRGVWLELPVQKGDTLHVMGAPVELAPDGSAHVVCDYDQGLVVLHPDVLLAGARGGAPAPWRCEAVRLRLLQPH